MKIHWLQKFPFILLGIGALFSVYLLTARKETQLGRISPPKGKGPPSFGVIFFTEGNQDEPTKTPIDSISKPVLFCRINTQDKSKVVHYLDFVKRLDPNSVVVHLPSDLEAELSSILIKLDHLYRAENIWMVYLNSQSASSEEEEWIRSPLKSYYARFVEQIRFQPETISIEWIEASLYAIGKYHLYELNKIDQTVS